MLRSTVIFSLKSTLKNAQKPTQNSREERLKRLKNAKPRGTDAGTAVLGCTGARAPTHSRVSCARVVVCWFCRNQMLLRQVHDCAPLSHTHVLHYFPLLCYP